MQPETRLAHRVSGRGWRSVGVAAILVVASTGLSGMGQAVAAAQPWIVGQPGAAAPAAGKARTAAAGPHDPIPASIARTDRVVVRWATGASGQPPDATTVASAAIVGTLSAATGRDVTFLRRTGSGAAVYRVGGRLGHDAARIIAAIGRVRGVAHVEADRWMTPSAAPNDTRAADLWGLLDPADGGSPYGIDATGAWSITSGSSAIRVAVIDTGLVAHSDLVGQSVAGYDMVSDSSISNDGDGRDANAADPGDWCVDDGSDSSWHGTHVAGTIAALANNALGVFGGAPGVRIQPIRVLGQCGGYESDVDDGIRWAAGGTTVPDVPIVNPKPARVLSLSLGGGGGCSVEDQQAVDYARGRGAVVVVAAGNENLDAATSSPGSCAGVITVAATDEAGRKASFSNFGPLVEVAAPGVGILSTINSGLTKPDANPGGSIYGYYDGTSMATPHVSLSAALLLSAHATLGPDTVAAVLADTATPVAPDTTANSCATRGCGAGIVNIARALAGLAASGPIVGQAALGTPGVAGAAQVTLRADAVDLSTVASAEYRVDGGPWQAMAAADGAFGGIHERVGATLAAPASAGSHTICVRAADPESNKSTVGGNACTVLTVDLTPPTVSGVAATPQGATVGSVATVSATAADSRTAIGGVQYRVDAGPWTAMVARDGAFNTGNETALAAFGGSATSVDGGAWHACAALADGTLRCWGYGADGQLGGSVPDDETSVPVVVPGIGNAAAVTAGGFHTCALVGSGGITCWGYNGDGELGDGGFSTVGPVAVTGISTAIAVTAGQYHTCALLANGTVRCWGSNADGQLGTGTLTSSAVPVAVSGLTGVVAIGAGAGHTCAVLSTGTARCWGANLDGQLGDGTTTRRLAPVAVSGLAGATRISAGEATTCAVLASGAARCWGANADGQLGDGTHVARHKPVAVHGITTAHAVATSGIHSCATLASGGVVCWGANDDGELGDGTFDASSLPVSVAGLVGGTAVTTGRSSTCAIIAGGAVRCWGLNDVGELGNGTLPTALPAGSPTPTKVVGLGGATKGSHEVCVRARDSVGRTSTSGPAACATVVFGRLTAGIVSSSIGATSAPTIPVRLDWTSGTEAAGVAAYQLQRSLADAAFTDVLLPDVQSTTVAVRIAPATRAQFRVRATGGGGAASPFVTAPAFRVAARQDSASTITYAGSGWATSTTSSAYGGTLRRASSAGATATTVVVGTSVAWVSTKGPSRGRAEVWLDGRRVATIDLFAHSGTPRRVVWSDRFAASGPHRVMIKVLGQHAAGATGNRVDIDAFLFMVPAP